ncbi:MAG: reprolysin-like metallopeptidase, partial [Bacteroidota bacterium]
MKKSILFLLMFLSGQLIWSQSEEAIWINRQAAELNIEPSSVLHSFTDNFRMVELEVNSLAPTLLSKEKGVKSITLPLPDGTETSLNITPVSVMAPGLAARYPAIQTYSIQPKGKTIFGGRVGWTAQGLHATIRTHQGTVYIDPYARHDNRHYAVYYVENNMQSDLWSQFECGTEGGHIEPDDVYMPVKKMGQRDKSLLGAATVQRKYRLAMACTGEYSVYHGGDNPSIEISLGALVIVVNRINEVLGVDLGIQLELIEEIEQIIFLDPDSDPYLLGSVSQAGLTGYLNGRNPEVINNTIGTMSYDIGHVVSTRSSGVGGLASLESVCTGNKASASSTIPDPVGDPFAIALVAHEMGHQFGGRHTQSGCQNVDVSSSVEPGGGTTIMGYAGICPSGFNVQSFTDDYYNNSSLVQMLNFSREANGDVCAQKIDEGNTLPEVNIDYENGFFIPISTPFELTATATDMEDDALTYCWEQADINASIIYNDELNMYGPQPGSPEGNSPIFRSFQPTEEATRVFPRLELIVNNIMSDAEVLPTYNRPMTFRCTVRDNHPTSGGVDWKEVEFRATEEAGPFLVTTPNTASATWQVGDYTEVTWDVANTDGAIVN